MTLTNAASVRDQESIRQFLMKRPWLRPNKNKDRCGLVSAEEWADIVNRSPLSDDRLREISLFMNGYEWAR